MGAVRTNWSGVRERVEALARVDEARQVFGAWDGFGSVGHHFRFADPLSEPEVAEAEARWGVSLPAEYRDFLLEVGAGGAGPGYGLSMLRRTDAGWRWTAVDIALRHDYLGLPFATEEERGRVLFEHDARRPQGAGFASEEAFHDAYSAWMTAGDELFHRCTSGALKLGHEGCGYCAWLVLSGPERGGMWMDDRPGDGEFRPLGPPRARVGFADWYLHWVEGAEAAARPRSRPR
ncbi:SMI1/KNR4 family protein [Streptomyces europaeiscabiei]|uniref:SMI1/KNR4 family protein n=1 Tax=Streptomyces europaeiscabiei TaxID=146819 RepID=UPI0029A1D10D|nr:SMI1/KNR4 family protein [Streptomyces europaeiscabiei]MDX2526816.1 SMI1/KNR4 family protein [Streptomyces europaeiscabiei]